MNPIKLSNHLQMTLVNYLTTTFDVNRDGLEPDLAEFIKRSFSRPRALFSGPYLEFTPPYKTAESLEELAAQNIVSSRLLSMQCFQQGRPLPIDTPLYTHQATALRKLSAEERNIVVSSGTGSGKTECFLIPILNDLLIDPSPGVRAVLVYPLNALVNDQLDRLRVLLRGTDITFGRYTSELAKEENLARKEMEQEWKDMEPSRQQLFDEYPLRNEIIGRDQIQQKGLLPQILITNYAMLEYLLLRPEDSPLFSQGKWRFVVLDEAHTYAGSQGIEVGLLMRRLKLRLGHKPGEMRCIATSATLTDDDAEDARQFAEALFGEEFSTDDIIFGELDHDYVASSSTISSQPPVEAYVHPRFGELIENVRQEQWESVDEMALLMEEIGLITAEHLSLADDYDLPGFLWETLRGNKELVQLRNYMADKGQPVEVAAVAEALFHSRLPVEQQQDALYHLIELAAMARPSVDKPSLLPARYHLFVRPPQGIWACLNPTCPDRHTENPWSKLFATPRETCDACQARVFPLVVCRTCGQVYVRLQKVGMQYLPEAAMADDPQICYVTWQSIRENRALAENEDSDDGDDEDFIMRQAGEGTLKQDEFRLCLSCYQEVKRNGACGCEKRSAQIASLFILKKVSTKKIRGRQGLNDSLVENMNECGRCHSRAIKGTEIATEITLNALTPLAVLTDDLYSQLPASTHTDIQKKAGGGRKLLSFYDSRQGAARFAAFVQDVVNRQAYRRIIVKAIKETSQSGRLPDLEKVSEMCLDVALQERLAHNDLEIADSDLPRTSQYLNQSQRERLMRHMRKQIFAEITTQLRSRQSLESLGLIAVQYFEDEQITELEDLAKNLNLTMPETRVLVEYLLDDLRRGKVVTLPDGVRRDDQIFGRNKFSPRLVRRDPNEYEIAWIGVTKRHHRRQLIAKILKYKGLSDDDVAIEKALDDILNWLRDKSNVLDTSRPSDGFQIRSDSLFFQTDVQWYRCNQCQRLNCRGDLLPCPHPYCQGTFEAVNQSELEKASFYYQKLFQTSIPMRIEEHTAQLAPNKGRDYQNQFKSGNINMLSCSTTFEMGIDLGDLQAVVMSNIPPTVANYKQRAGRAGRRTSGTAFILAWASNRPHDQTYFRSPADIIGGRVRVPYIDIQNPIIIQRHVNAILLSDFLRFCFAQDSYTDKVGIFFDEQSVGGSYYARMPQWSTKRKNKLLELLSVYSKSVNGSIDPHNVIDEFERNLSHKGFEHYQTIAGYYKEALQNLTQKQVDLVMHRGGDQDLDLDSLLDEIKRYNRLLSRIQKEDLINYLSDRGVLPSYSFPLHVVELRIPPHLLEAGQLRLQRNLQQAIREYAPGQEIVADKKIWKSEALDFFGKEPQIFAYHICPKCNHLRLENTPGKSLEHLDEPCPLCNTIPPTRQKKWPQYQYIQPDGFRASNNSGQPAGQYVDRPYNLMRSALVPGPVDTKEISQVLSVGYDRKGALLYVNEGFQGGGFRICPKCGKQVSKRGNKCDGKLNGQPCPGKLEGAAKSTLGFKQDTDTLHLKFSSTPYIPVPLPEDTSFWLSLTYALLQGASRALQIERRDIDGVLFPEEAERNWRQTIVLYDNVPGGAGHVKRIQDEMEHVIAAALEIVDCDCERSCYRCLREYANQWEHHLLNREPVAQFLRALDADLQQNRQGDIAGLHRVSAVNSSLWLWEQLQRIQQKLILYAEEITANSPTVDGLTWLDLIQQLLQRGIKIRLYLNKLPDQTTGCSEAIIVATHLRLLIQKQLDLRQTNRQLPWTAVFDPDIGTPGAIKHEQDKALILSRDISGYLVNTNRSNHVGEIWQAMEEYSGRLVEYSDLRMPPDTRVIEVHPDGRRHNESEYFADFYAKPIRGMIVSDRYLNTKEKILERLGAHLELAKQSGELAWVVVNTQKYEDEQQSAINQLRSRFSDINIKFNFDHRTEHDRYIEVTQVNGSKDRIIIGLGLDFIQSSGDVRKTFLVFQQSII